MTEARCIYCGEKIDDVAVVVKIGFADFYAHPKCDTETNGEVLLEDEQHE